MAEIWEEILDHPNYHVSNLGRVKHIKFNRILAQRFDKSRLKVNLSTNGVAETRIVHRLVAEAFIPNPDGNRRVQHKNGDCHDNRSDNLQWC